MLQPIGTPRGVYTAGDKLFLDDIPLWTEDRPIEEPRLLRTDVVWTKQTETAESMAGRLGGLLGHDRLGGRITVCVLCYGDDYIMHRRCLSSIVRTVPQDRLDLRIALNCVGADTSAYVAQLAPTKIYAYDTNRFKYPIMRDMFWDTRDPIITPYVVWFDDDTYASHNNWLNQLAQTIVKQPANVGMFGNPVIHQLKPGAHDPRNWFRSATWFKGKNFRTVRGNDAPNGDCIHYCSGWFWAIKTDAIRQCDIPCSRLVQAGGDIVIGEQLHQNGLQIKRFNIGKSVVYTEPPGVKPRRMPSGHVNPWLMTAGTTQ